MTQRSDLHFHLLPGVDDGPGDTDASVELARAAVADGTRTVVATPHVRRGFVTEVVELRERVRELRAALVAAAVPLEVHCGGELGHDMVFRLRQDELDRIAQGPPGARWLLLEAPFAGMGEDFHAAADELRARGFGVLVAHPERSADAALDGCAGLRRELAAGAVAQVNALSFAGRHGPDAQRTAYRLVEDGAAVVIASDAHGRSRPPALRTAEAALVDHGLSPGAARTLTSGAPRRLLERGVPGDALAA